MNTHFRLLRNRSFLVKDCIITLVLWETSRVIVSVLIVLGVISFPQSAKNPVRAADHAHTVPAEVKSAAISPRWTYIGWIFCSNLGGATRRSGKVLLFVSRRINKGYGYDFAYVKEDSSNSGPCSAERAIPGKLSASAHGPFSRPIPATAYLMSRGYDDGTAADHEVDYLKPPVSINDIVIIPYGSTHPDVMVPEELQGQLSQIQIENVSGIVSGMSSGQIKDRLRQDLAFRQQIKNAVGEDTWRNLKTSKLSSDKQ